MLKISKLLFIEILSMLLFMYFVSILTNNLSAEEYGDYAAAYSFVFFIFVILLVGADLISIKEITPLFEAKDLSGIRSYLLYSLIIIIFASIIFYVCVGISYYNGIGDINHPIFFVSIFIPMFAISYLYYRTLIALGDTLTASVLYSVCLPFLLIVISSLELKYNFLESSRAAIFVVVISWSMISLFFIYKCNSQLRLLGKVGKIQWGAWLKVGSVSMLFSIVTRSIADICIILSELFLKNEAKVGVFSLIIMLSLFVGKVIIRIMYVVFLPKIALLIGSKDYLGLRNILNRNYTYFVVFGLVLIIMVWFFGDNLLGFYGSQYTSAHTSLVIMFLAQSVTLVFFQCGLVINYFAKTTFIIINSLAFIFLVILLSYLLSGYSVLGLSIGYLIAVSIVYASKYIYVNILIKKGIANQLI